MFREDAVALAGYPAQEWDTQIESDALEGRLDRLIREAEDSISADRVRSLP